MPVNQTLASLSQTPASNGPLGSDPPSSLDDSIRFGLSFIAQLRDGTGFSPNAITSAIGFTPIQQGTGAGQGPNTIRIGWADGFLRLQVDPLDWGTTWPINIHGNAASANFATNAATATSATSAGSATTSGTANFANNAGALAGRTSNGWVQNFLSENILSWAWDGNAMVGRVDGNVQYALTEWGRVANRPVNVTQFSNDARYVQAEGIYGRVLAAAPDGTAFVGFALPVQENRIGRIGVVPGGLFVTADGNNFSWPINPSDERLKKNIRPTQEDSAAKILSIDFKAFDFNDAVPMFSGISRKSGVVAQQLETIDSEWVTEGGDYKQLNLETMLTSVAHALQQALVRIDELERKK